MQEHNLSLSVSILPTPSIPINNKDLSVNALDLKLTNLTMDMPAGKCPKIPESQL
jgi:hypothetical protein